MGQTPSLNDRFGRPAAPAKTRLGGGQDRFAGAGPSTGKLDHFGKAGVGARGDAFAARQAARSAPVDKFAGKAAPIRAEGLAPSGRPAAAPEPAPVKRADLRLVPRQVDQDIFVAPTELLDVNEADVQREKVLRRRPGRSSSLVLVSAAKAMTASDVAEAPPPPPVLPAATLAPPPPAVEAPRRRPPRGGGGSGGGAPPRERTFNQDDFVGVMLGVMVLFLLLLWLLRGGQPQTDNQVVGVQSAMNEPIVLPAATAPAPMPAPDPFGNAAVDLTPKGPIPEAAQEAPAEAKAAPVPAAAPVGDRAMHAWFCTAGAKLTTASRNALGRELTQFSEAFSGRELIVRGYADTRGSSEFNSALGGERARVVADFLRTKGLTVVDDRGVGELSGLDDNQNCSNQRRVDVFVKGGPGETPSRACTPEPAVEDLVCG